MIISCSWCDRWKQEPDGEWQKTEGQKKDDADSHGICPTCEADFMQQLTSAKQADVLVIAG